jgi:hypothetical protein
MFSLFIPSTTPTSSMAYHAPPPPSSRNVSPLFHWGHIVDMHEMDPTFIHHEEIRGLGLAHYLIRTPSMGWWEMVEQREDHTSIIGDRFLVRHDEEEYRDNIVIRDYISTRIDTPAKWSRQSVVYYKDCTSPYEYHHDRFRDRFNIDHYIVQPFSLPSL